MHKVTKVSQDYERKGLERLLGILDTFGGGVPIEDAAVFAIHPVARGSNVAS